MRHVWLQSEHVSFQRFIKMFVCIRMLYRDKIGLVVLEMLEIGELQKLHNKWWYGKGECVADDSKVSICTSQANFAFYFYSFEQQRAVRPLAGCVIRQYADDVGLQLIGNKNETENQQSNEKRSLKFT